MDPIQSKILSTQQAINGDTEIFNSIKSTKSEKKQLEKVAKEFESIFITKMVETFDKTIDKEGGIFGSETSYLDKFKSFIFQEMGREMANNPRTSFGFAKQIYNQMEKYVPETNKSTTDKTI